MQQSAIPQSRPMMRIDESVMTCLRKYADFTGRATRAEFWWWCLAIFLVSMALNIFQFLLALISLVPLLGFLGLFSIIFNLLGLALSLGTILPNLAVTARRLHDIGRSGWWILVWFAAYFSAAIPLIVGLILGFVALEFDRFIWDRGWESFYLWAPVIVGAAISLLAGLGLTTWIIIWLVKQGQTGPNQHGPDPRAWEPAASQQTWQ